MSRRACSLFPFFVGGCFDRVFGSALLLLVVMAGACQPPSGERVRLTRSRLVVHSAFGVRRLPALISFMFGWGFSSTRHRLTTLSSVVWFHLCNVFPFAQTKGDLSSPLQQQAREEYKSSDVLPGSALPQFCWDAQKAEAGSWYSMPSFGGTVEVISIHQQFQIFGDARMKTSLAPEITLKA